ncbi:unnamed protein product [Staurois parvus]|uniref:Uncharacterized protein n=1 Tax=Staurois parvus TaxID=386267 RepID=A0ABN9DPQ0_9NEOB|nr:unnamed protein product [Staurois parvus]
MESQGSSRSFSARVPWNPRVPPEVSQPGFHGIPGFLKRFLSQGSMESQGSSRGFSARVPPKVSQLGFHGIPGFLQRLLGGSLSN